MFQLMVVVVVVVVVMVVVVVVMMLMILIVDPHVQLKSAHLRHTNKVLNQQTLQLSLVVLKRAVGGPEKGRFIMLIERR